MNEPKQPTETQKAIAWGITILIALTVAVLAELPALWEMALQCQN